MHKTTIPQSAKRVPLRPLALGEATGHNHRLVCLDSSVAVEEICSMYEWEDNGTRMGLRVTAEGISLIHAAGDSLNTADHHPHLIAPGEYEVVIQSEETNWGRATVVD